MKKFFSVVVAAGGLLALLVVGSAYAQDPGTAIRASPRATICPRFAVGSEHRRCG